MKKISAAVTILSLMALLAGCAGSKKAAPRQDDVQGSRAYRLLMAGDLPRAIEVYKSAFAAARKTDNGIGAARSLSNIGRIYFELGQADSAALYFGKAHEEFKIFGYNAGASGSAAFIALCFATAGDNAQAEHWFSVASSLISTGKKMRKEDEHYLAVIRGLIDYRLASKVNNESALNAAMTFYRKKRENSLLSTVYLLMADVEFARGDSAAAIRYLRDALASLDESQELYRRSGALLKLAAISFCAGDQNAGKHFYERAVGCAPKGVAVPTIEQVSSCQL